MKILMVHQNRDEMYGAAHSMLELLTNLNETYGVEPVILASSEGNVTAYCKRMHWEYHIVGLDNFMMGAGTKEKQFIRTVLYPVLWVRYKVKCARALRLTERCVDFDEIDLIHTNTNVCDVGAILAERHSKPHVWHLREFGDLDYNRISFRKDYIDFMNTHATRFIAISDAVRNHWIGKGLEASKVYKVYNGVENISYEEKKKEGEILRVVFSGSISESKGQYLLINAVAALPENYKSRICVDIIGDGPKGYVNSLKASVAENKLEDIVHFLGYMPNVREHLNDYDVGIVCSRSEGFGRVTAEYMMAGLCTIASNTGANTELIENGVTGFLFDYPNPESLSSCLMTILDAPNIAREIGIKSQSYSLKSFTAEINAKNIYNNYMQVMTLYKKD